MSRTTLASSVAIFFPSCLPPRRRCRLPHVSAVYNRFTPLRFPSTLRRDTSSSESRFYLVSGVDTILVVTLVTDGQEIRGLGHFCNTAILLILCRRHGIDTVLLLQTLGPTERRYSPDWLSATHESRFPSNSRTLHRTAVYESRGSETVRRRCARHPPLYFCVRTPRYSRAVIELGRAALFAYQHACRVPRIPRIAKS